METLGFILAAAGLLTMASQVVLQKSPLRSALALIATLGFQAMLYVLLSAPFVAAMQILVYAGAIMVLFVFVIMLLNLGDDANARPPALAFSKLLGVAGLVFIAVRLASSALRSGGIGGSREVPALDGSVKHIGEILLSDHLLAFEAVSLVLLVAVVGSVVLGQRRAT